MRAIIARVAWQLFITARPFIKNLETGLISLCHLAAQHSPPSGSS